MIVTILIFIIILAVLVFVHEAGHFFVAIRSGMKVEEFGFGFPPRIGGIQKIDGKWKFVWGMKQPLDPEKTVYSINWIPLGGFVKILGENNEDEHDPRSFINRPFWGRFLTLVAGVCMNIILAWVLVSVGYIVGLPTAIDTKSNLPHHAVLKNSQVAVIDLAPGGPAEKSGIQAGDVILQLDHQSFSTIDGDQQYIRRHQGDSIDFTLLRINKQLDVKVQSIANPGPDQGPTGVELANLGKLSFPWYWAPIEGIRTVYEQTLNIFSGLYALFTTKAGLAAVGGPVKIAKLTGQVADLGFIYVIQFAAFLSLNLAILNILPFPALDGGRILFLIIEKIRGKRNNQQLEQVVNTAGFVFLLLLMVAVTIKDIVNK